MLASYSKENGLEFIWDSLNRVKDVTPEVKSQISQLVQTAITDFDKTAIAFKITDESVIGFMESMQKSSTVYTNSKQAIAGYHSYLQSTTKSLSLANLGTKALSVSMKVLSSIGWTIAFALIAKGIQFAATAIDNLSHSSEKCKERVDELMSSFKSSLDTANLNASTVEDLAGKYETLSKGVNNLGENVSLTADEYAEYNNIVNKIAEMFPTLVSGYTDESNAILTLKGNVNELRDAYKKAQQEAYFLLIVSGENSDGNDIIKNFDNQVFGKQSALSKSSPLINGEAGAKDAIDVITRLTGALTPQEFRDTYNLLYKEYENIWKSDKIQNALKSSGFEDLTHFPKWSELTSEDLANVKHNAQATIQTYEAEIKKALSSVQTLANAYLMTNGDYSSLDEQSKAIASQIVNTIDVNVADGFENKEGAGAYVQSILDVLKYNPDAKDAMLGLFTSDLSEMSPDQAKEIIDQYINKIAEVLGEDALELKVRLGFDSVDELATKYDNALKAAQDKFGTDQSDFFTKKSINTTEEIDDWLQCADAADSAADAEQRYLNIGKENQDSAHPLSTSELISKLDSELAPAFSALKTAYQNIFKLEDDKEIFSLENVDLSMLSSMKSELDNISNELMIDIDYSSYENLARVLTDSSSTADDVKNAFGELSTTLLGSLSGALAECTEEDAKLLQSMLEKMGVINAEVLVLEALRGRYIDVAEASNILSNASLDLESVTWAEINALELEGTIVPEVAARLSELAFAKQIANAENMDTSGEVANLLNLAENAGYTGKVIEYLTELEQIYQEVASGTFDAPEIIKKNERAAELQRLIKAESSKISFNPKVAYNPNVSSGKAKQSAASAGKQTADAYVEAFDKELKKLDNLKSYGKITEKQYLDALRRLYVKYYGQKKQYLEQYEKYEHQYLSGMKLLYESAFSYITKQIDKRISEVENQRDTEIKGLEAQKKAAEDAYQAQIDGVDEQIKGIEKQIDAKNDEIDAINEAAEARKRELDLQKAQYDLERMQNQKTNYVMTDSGFQYQADTSGIRDARESVEDAKREIEIGKIEETINGLEQQKVILEEQRTALEMALEASNAYWDAQIENTNQYYDTLIGNLEAYKSRFEELANMEETAKMQATLAELGIAEQDILNMSEEAFQRVKDSYLAILADMYSGNEQMKGQLAELSELTASTGFDTSGLAASSDEVATAIGKIQESTGGAAEGMQPLTTELDKLKTLLSEVTALLDSLQFPEIGDEDYAQKLSDIAQGFEIIIEKCKEFNQIDFSKIIGSGGSPASTGTAATGAVPGIDQGIDAPEASGGGSGFLGLSSAISEAVRSITFQMTLLGLALTIGNLAFAAQIAMINKQYIPAWENLQKRLAEIIGVGGGSENSKNPSSPSTRSVSNTGESADASSGGGTSIIETLQIGGEEVSKKLENPWLSSFTDFATGDNSVQSICEKIKQLVEEMAAAIKEQCESAARALSDLSAQYFSNPALNGQSTAKESAKNALKAAGNAINKATARSASVYTPLAQSNPDKYNMLMRFSSQPAPIEAVPLIMSGFNHEMKDAIKNVSNATTLSQLNKAVNINIGDIKVEGVADAGGLAQAIKERLPNMLLQELKKG